MTELESERGLAGDRNSGNRYEDGAEEEDSDENPGNIR